MSCDSNAGIKPIDKSSVHRICSGQVILTLSTAVKELIENSLDAQATSIDVRLKAFGEQSIEVSDNGQGIQPNNFHSIALKHHTSKLREFSDLIDVETFGFRGEALSSLCALSELSLSTRSSSEPNGTKIDFDSDGQIRNEMPCARQVGTSVLIKNIFKPLPVRHKEFVKNVKREFNKMCGVLYSYCLIRPDVKLTCSNTTDNGKKTNIIQTHGTQQILPTISTIFGHDQTKSLQAFYHVQPSAEILSDFGLTQQVTDGGPTFKLSGYVSVCGHGLGRSTADRQFYFINKRPCDNPKLSRIVNEVYHQFNRHQYPFVFLDISFVKDSVDVNVTPDKRQIFLQNENMLLATIKMSLNKMYSESSGSQLCTSMQNQSKLLENSFKAKMAYSTPSPSVNINNLKRQFSSFSSADRGAKQAKLDSFSFCQTPPPSITSPVKAFQPSSSLAPIADKDQPNSSVGESPDFNGDTAATQHNESIPQSLYEHINKKTAPDIKASVHPSVTSPVKAFQPSPSLVPTTDEDQPNSSVGESPKFNGDTAATQHNESIPQSLYEHINKKTAPDIKASEPDSMPVADADQTKSPRKESLSFNDSINGNLEFHMALKTAASPCPNPPPQCETIVDSCEHVNKKTATVNISLAAIRKACAIQDERLKKAGEKCIASFKAKIKPEDNKAAEQELSKAISKDMFDKMQVLFQFNMGFIITKLNSDLFIIDQHATDEKYNFEMLKQNEHLQTQRLICGQPLSLTVVDEAVLKDNLNIFNNNGFHFEFDKQQKPILVSVPAHKNHTFGKQEIDELIFMLSDSPGVMCRPSRVQQMFAMQACRKSIMVGTGLTKANMAKLVSHMGQIEQPWNCPHGRPTIRHLINLNLLHS